MDAMNDAKMSFVKVVKYFTTKEPWNAATTREMMILQKLIQTRQVRNSTSAFFENLNNASSKTMRGPVTPKISNSY